MTGQPGAAAGPAPDAPRGEASSGLGSLVSSAGFTGAGRLADGLVRYLSLAVLARMLGAEGLGLFVVARTAAAMLGAVSELGMGYGAVRQIAFHAARDDDDGVQQSVRIALLFPALCGTAAALALGAGAERLARSVFHQPALAGPLRLLALAVPLVTLVQVLLEVLRGFREIRSRVLIESYLLPLSNLGLLAVFAALGRGLEGAVLAFVLSYAVTALALAAACGRRVRLTGKGPFIRAEAARQFFRVSLPLTFVNVFVEVKNRVDVLLLGALASASDTSVYFVSLRLSSFLSIPWQASHMAFAPAISGDYSRGDVARIEFNYAHLTKLVFTGSLLAAGFLLAFPRDVLALFGSSFDRGQPILVLICLGLLVKSAVGNAGPILAMTGRTHLNMAVMVVSLGSMTLLNVLLIPRLGLAGAAIAHLVTVTATSLLELLLVHRHLGIHPFRHDFVKPVLAAAAAGAAAAAARPWLPPPAGVVAAMALYPLVFTGVLLALGLSQEERRLLASARRRAPGHGAAG